MKGYEAHETSRKSMRRLPICVRIDGRAFSTWTRGLDKPYHAGLSKAMVETTKFLVDETHAKVGYTQSDEITLIFWDDSDKAEPLFGGKFFKLTSVIASLATAKFNALVPELVPEKAGRLATFDTRIFQVPSKVEATNLVMWRWFDARKNSVSMLAQSVFSHRQLHGVSGIRKIEMLQARDIEWDDYPDFFKWGTFVQRRSVQRELTAEELDRIPERHRPSGPVTRSSVVELEMPPFNTISNPVEVLFDSQEPSLK